MVYSTVIDAEIVEGTETGSDLVTVDQGETALSVELVEDLQGAARYAEQSRSESTRKAYGVDWSHFVGYCESVKADPLPAEPATVAVYDLDAEKWRELVAREQVPGIQVRAFTEQESRGLMEALRIPAVPIYMILDAEGRIIDHRAPGPGVDALRMISEGVHQPNQ